MSDSIVALDLITGRIRWHFQATANDAWNVACFTKSSGSCPDEAAPDFDFGAGIVLAGGTDGRDYVLAGQKSGEVYALDPDKGTLRVLRAATKTAGEAIQKGAEPLQDRPRGRNRGIGHEP